MIEHDPNTGGLEPLGGTPEVATYLKVSPRTLETWARRGYGPAFSKVGKYRRYRWSDVKRFLDERQQVSA